MGTTGPPDVPQGVDADSTDHLAQLRRYPSRDLLRMYAATLTVLLERGVVRTRNAPAGDLAEHLVARAYGGALAPNSEKSYDVTAEDGRRLQVKCRVVAKRGASVYSVFRSWDFDACVFVRLDPVDYDVLEAWEVPMAEVKALARDVAWVRGSRLTTATRFETVPGAHDVTDRLRTALATLPDEMQETPHG